MTSSKGLAGLALLVLSLIGSFAKAQQIEIAGQVRDCNWLPALNAALNYNGEGLFRGWTEHDGGAAKGLIEACKPRLFGDRARFDRMEALLESRWDEVQHRQKAQRQQQELFEARARTEAARIQQDADAYSKAHAGETHSGRAVRIFFVSNVQYHTGDTIPGGQLNTILFTGEPCPLQLADRDSYLRAWMNFASNQLGCWAPTIDDGFIFIGSLPSLTHVSQVPWEAYPRALLHPDGSATITEPAYDSKTFLAQVMGRKTMEQIQAHRNERP